MTGFSVTTAYGNRKMLEALNGVESVYVAPTFALPETVMILHRLQTTLQR